MDCKRDLYQSQAEDECEPEAQWTRTTQAAASSAAACVGAGVSHVDERGAVTMSSTPAHAGRLAVLAAPNMQESPGVGFGGPTYRPTETPSLTPPGPVRTPRRGGCRPIRSGRLRCLTSAEPLNHVGGRDYHPRELRASEPHVEYKLAQDLKPRRRPIIQSGFRSTNAAYPLLHIDTLNNALSSSARRDDVDPVLHVPGYSSDGKQSACCHVKCGDVRILAPISGDGTC